MPSLHSMVETISNLASKSSVQALAAAVLYRVLGCDVSASEGAPNHQGAPLGGAKTFPDVSLR